jgi:Asp-tRNA(Asn)/Glu-tRNA(Gln) amidotransferase A subunit family amidase
MAQESTRRYAENKTLSLIDGVPVAIKEEIRVVRE